jgi:hypothetical protein
MAITSGVGYLSSWECEESHSKNLSSVSVYDQTGSQGDTPESKCDSEFFSFLNCAPPESIQDGKPSSSSHS